MNIRLLRILAVAALFVCPAIGQAQITSCTFAQNSVYYKLYGSVPVQSLTVSGTPGTNVKISGTSFLVPINDTIGVSGSLTFAEPYTFDKLLPFVGLTTTIGALCADPVTGVGVSASYELVVDGAGSVSVTPPVKNLEYVIGSFTPLIPGSLTVSNADTGFAGNLDSLSVAIVFKQGSGWPKADTIPLAAVAPYDIKLTSDQDKMNKAPAGLDTALVIVSSTKKGLLVTADTSYIIVRVWAKPALALSKGLSIFSYAQGDVAPAPDTLSIINSGVDLATVLGRTPYNLQNLQMTYEYSPGSEGTWLAPTLSGPVTPGFLMVKVDPTGLLPKNDLDPRTYTAFIILTDGGVAVSTRYEVRLIVYPAKATISLDRTSFSYVLGIGEAPSRPDTVHVVNSGTGAKAAIQNLKVRVVYQGTAPSWLIAQLNSTVTPATLTVQPVPGTLPKGTYQATIYVEDTLTTNRSVAVPVTLSLVEGAVLRVDSTSLGTSSLQFNVSGTTGQGQTATAKVWLGSTLGKITDLKTQIRYISSTGTGNWLSASLSPTSTPSVLTVTVSGQNLAAGQYNAQIDVSSSLTLGAAVSIPVRTVVTKQGETTGTLTLEKDTLNLSYTPSDTLGRIGQVSVGGAGTVSINAASLPTWLSANLNGVALPGMISLKITGVPTSELSTLSLVVQGGNPATQKTLVIKVASLENVGTEKAILGLQSNILTDAEKVWLDARGNKNGRVDVGDISALLLKK